MSQTCKNCQIEYQLITNYAISDAFCPYCGKPTSRRNDMKNLMIK